MTMMDPIVYRKMMRCDITHHRSNKSRKPTNNSYSMSSCSILY